MEWEWNQIKINNGMEPYSASGHNQSRSEPIPAVGRPYFHSINKFNQFPFPFQLNDLLIPFQSLPWFHGPLLFVFIGKLG